MAYYPNLAAAYSPEPPEAPVKTEPSDALPDVVQDLTHWVARTLDENPSKRAVRGMVKVLLKGYAELRESYRQVSEARDLWMRKTKELDGSRNGWQEEAERQAKNVEYWRGKAEEAERVAGGVGYWRHKFEVLEEENTRAARLLEQSTAANKRLTAERGAARALCRAYEAATAGGVVGCCSHGVTVPMAKLRVHLLAAAEALDELEQGGGPRTSGGGVG